MNYKVCILAAGPSRRIGDYSDHVHKAILPVNFKAVISYIIEKFPDDVEIVIAVGHRKETIIEYLSVAYPERKFTFVEIEKYIGPGTGPGQTLLECKDHLDCPFILTTADTIVTESIPAPTENWFGIAPTSDPERYTTVEIENNTITEIIDKQKTTNTHAFIGIAGIKDYDDFFLALETNNDVIAGEVQVSNGFKGLLNKRITAKEFTWFDTGSLEGYHAAHKHFSKEAFDFSKDDEFLYFVNSKVIKFFADSKITQNRVKRAIALKDLCPQIIGVTHNFYSYNKIPGKTVYDALDNKVAMDFFTWAQNNLWIKKNLTKEQAKEFEKVCEKFYKEKTLHRLEKVYSKTGIADSESTVNGERVPALKELLAQIDWNYLYKGAPSSFHGDLQFDNVLLVHNQRPGTNQFVLLDWRQDFAGLIEYGDMYYDLAKLYGGLIISYKLIKQNKFSCDIRGDNITFDLQTTEDLVQARHLYERFIEENGYDLQKVKLITSLIFLNMSPLHHAPFDVLLYYLGKSMLYKTLAGQDEVTTSKKKKNPPLMCIGPMSKQVVDTVIDFSYHHNIPINLIASRSQIETAALGGGYANNWTTEDFAAYIRDKLKDKQAKVLICRDHGGPWLGADEKELAEKHAMLAAKASYEADIAAGFNMIHIDTSINPGGFDMEASLRRAFELLLFCEEKSRQYGTKLLYEIGTEDADGGIVEPDMFEHFLSKIIEFCGERNIPKPLFIVARTGTHVREMHQAGEFHPDNTRMLLAIAQKYGVGIKEHNTDYDNAENHQLRFEIGVTAINIAPEFGVLETNVILKHCKKKNREDLYERFIELAYNSKKWKKWLKHPDVTTKEEKAMIAGHYIFGSKEFQEMKKELPELDEEIRQAIWKRLEWYADNLGWLNHNAARIETVQATVR